MKNFIDLYDLELDARTIRRLDESFCRKEDIVALAERKDGNERVVYLGMLDTSRRDLIGQVEMKLKSDVEPIQVNDYELDRALDFGFLEADDDTRTSFLRARSVREDLRLSHVNEIEFRREQPAPKIVADTIATAIRRRATDIHVERFGNDIDLRFRVDGVLHPIQTPITLTNLQHVINHIKALASMDVAEHRRPQDGHIVTIYRDEDGSERQTDLRVSIIPGPHGEDIVLRVLDEAHMLYDLSQLGMREQVFDKFHDMLHKKSGIILVTGPTSSGKTTTLYSALNHVKGPHNKILTAEDPIEYEMPKVSQKQVSPKMSFSEYTRVFLRQNPDIIMVGEIRDDDTAAVALRASQVGLLVFSTLHTKDAASAVVRMVTLGIDPRLLSASLLGALSQRLVRTICEECREKYQPDQEVLDRLPPMAEDMEFVHGKGCDACGSTGYSGMTGVFEILYFDEPLRRLIAEGEYVSEDEISGSLDYRRMYDDAIAKAKDGITTVEEIDRVVPIPDFYTPADQE